MKNSSQAAAGAHDMQRGAAQQLITQLATQQCSAIHDGEQQQDSLWWRRAQKQALALMMAQREQLASRQQQHYLSVRGAAADRPFSTNVPPAPSLLVARVAQT